MKTIVPVVQETYSCNVCQKLFSPPFLVENEWYCSEACFIKFCCRVLEKYNHKELVTIFFYYSNESLEEIYNNLLKLSNSQLICENTKHYVSAILQGKRGHSHSQNPV